MVSGQLLSQQKSTIDPQPSDHMLTDWYSKRRILTRLQEARTRRLRRMNARGVFSAHDNEIRARAMYRVEMRNRLGRNAARAAPPPLKVRTCNPSAGPLHDHHALLQRRHTSTVLVRRARPYKSTGLCFLSVKPGSCYCVSQETMAFAYGRL